MSPRVATWIGGLILGLLLAAILPESMFPGVRPAILGSALLVTGLIGELVEVIRARRSGHAAVWALDRRPADGRVDIAHLAGARSLPNPVDPRFGRYLGVDVDVSFPAKGSESTRLSERMSPPLLGRVVVVSLFVGRDGRSWSDDEIASAHSVLERAGAWLEREAIRWGAAVNIEMADTYFVFDDHQADDVFVGFVSEGEDVGPLEQGATHKALVGTTRAAAQLGFQDVGDMFHSIAARLDGNATVWLVHTRRAGRSFALPREQAELRGVSFAVCYVRESSFPEPLIGPARIDPVTLAHELLHLFGATDKYGRSLSDFASQTVSSREIMRLDETRLSRLRIDSRTAAEIGWPAPDSDRQNSGGRREPQGFSSAAGD
jgi:hypothetical protein